MKYLVVFLGYCKYILKKDKTLDYAFHDLFLSVIFWEDSNCCLTDYSFWLLAFSK